VHIHGMTSQVLDRPIFHPIGPITLGCKVRKVTDRHIYGEVIRIEDGRIYVRLFNGFIFPYLPEELQVM